MLNSTNKKRILVDTLLLLSVFWFPWWVTCVFAVLATIVLEFFVESLIVGILLDTLYGISNTSFIKSFPLTLLFALIFLISFWTKDHFTFTNR